MANNPYIGSSFDDFLMEEGILEECTQFAIDKVSEWQRSNKNKILQISNCEKKSVTKFVNFFQRRDNYVYSIDKRKRHLKGIKKATSSC